MLPIGSAPVVWIRAPEMAVSVGELMPEAHPLLLDEHMETAKCPIVGIKTQLCQRYHLRRPVPPVA